MEDRELLLKSDPEFDRLAFTVLAIEASAQKMGISPSEMRKRLDKVGLINEAGAIIPHKTKVAIALWRSQPLWLYFITNKFFLKPWCEMHPGFLAPSPTA